MDNIIGIIDEENTLTDRDELIIQNSFIKNKDTIYKHIYLYLKDSLDNIEFNNLERILGKPYFDIETEYISFTNPLPNGHCLYFETDAEFKFLGNIELFG